MIIGAAIPTLLRRFSGFSSRVASLQRAVPLLLWTALSLGIASRASAQKVHVVTGIVFDSVAGTPLSGAIVQVVQLDTALRATSHVFLGVTDGRGRYVIGSVPTGRVAVGFQHDALTALGLDSPLRVVAVEGEADVTVDLAVPAGTVLRTRNCEGPANGDGMLTGSVRDAQTESALDSVAVDVRWVELTRSAGSYRTVPHRVVAQMADEGRYVACGVTTAAPVMISATRHGYRSVGGEVTIPAGGTLRRDFHLSGERVEHGTAVLVGHVVHGEGAPVSTGHLVIPALGVDVPVVHGTATITGVPPGTWVAEARAIGYEPQRAMVDLVASGIVNVTLVLGRKVQLLEGMKVVGRPSADYRRLADAIERRRVGFGTWFLAGDERLARAEEGVDLLMTAPGFHLLGSVGVDGRQVESIRGGSRCLPSVYVDGFKLIEKGVVPVPVNDILALAAYPDMTGTPVQWRDGRTCAVIAVWTKH